MPPRVENAFLCQCGRIDRSYPFKSKHLLREHQGCRDTLLAVSLQFSFQILMCQLVNKLFIEFYYNQSTGVVTKRKESDHFQPS